MNQSCAKNLFNGFRGIETRRFHMPSIPARGEKKGLKLPICHSESSDEA